MLDFTKGILDKYADVHRRYTELSDYLISPEIIADNRLYLKYAEEKASLEKAYLLGEGLKLAIERIMITMVDHDALVIARHDHDLLHDTAEYGLDAFAL